MKTTQSDRTLKNQWSRQLTSMALLVVRKKYVFPLENTPRIHNRRRCHDNGNTTDFNCG